MFVRVETVALIDDGLLFYVDEESVKKFKIIAIIFEQTESDRQLTREALVK